MRTVNKYPEIDPAMLDCLAEVIVPEQLASTGALDRDAADYSDEQRLAGADCRAKLGWVKALVATWPR